MQNYNGSNKESLLSVVIPVYNEEQNIIEFHNRLSNVLDKINLRKEIIFVDDGSTDSGISMIKELQAKNHTIAIVCLSRNFGHQIALAAGLDYASGNAVVTIDADLQDPPELILNMVSEWQKGYDVVNTIREKRKGENIIKRLTASVFYWLLQKITPVNLSMGIGDYRLMDRKVVNAVKQIKERHRYIRGLVSWVGYRHTAITYIRQKRNKGKPKYSLWKSFILAIDAITTFSYFPLRLATVVGFLFSSFALLISLYVVILRLFTKQIEVTGYAALFVAITFLGGIQLIVLGILGEYLGRCFEEARGRPLYFVREAIKPIN